MPVRHWRWSGTQEDCGQICVHSPLTIGSLIRCQPIRPQRRKMKATPNNLESKITKQVKKPYSSPQIMVYGNIREITQSTGMISNMAYSGGVPGNPKPH